MLGLKKIWQLIHYRREYSSTRVKLTKQVLEKGTKLKAHSCQKRWFIARDLLRLKNEIHSSVA